MDHSSCMSLTIPSSHQVKLRTLPNEFSWHLQSVPHILSSLFYARDAPGPPVPAFCCMPFTSACIALCTLLLAVRTTSASYRVAVPPSEYIRRLPLILCESALRCKHSSRPMFQSPP